MTGNIGDNKVTKLKIVGTHSDPTDLSAQTQYYDSAKGQSGGDTFEALINPEKINHTRTIKYNSENNANTSTHDVMQFQGYGEEQLSFDLVIDGTQITGGNVDSQLKRLYDVVYKYKGEIHQTYYNVIIWGNYGFKGRLKSMKVEYNLFAIDGKPLRAKVSLSFSRHISPEAVQSLAYNRSPDMSHLKTMRSEDNIPLICYSIYDDINQYIQIADVNGLTNFRKIKVGSQLTFPPLV